LEENLDHDRVAANKSPESSVQQKSLIPLRFLRAPKLTDIPLPTFKGAHAIWGATGRDSKGQIYFGVAGYGVDDPSAHLFRLTPENGIVKDLGGVNAKLDELKVRRQDPWPETQVNIHSKIVQAEDGKIYFGSQNVSDELSDGSRNSKFGGRLFALDPKNDQWECVLTAPEGLISLACEKRYVYVMGYFGNVLYQYDTKSKKTRSVTLGTMGGHVSRNIFVDSREHLYSSRLIPGKDLSEPGTTMVGTTLVKSTLVEVDTELNVCGEWPLVDYAPTMDTESHGITGFCRMRDGSTVFVAHTGALWQIGAKGTGDSRLKRLGWLHYKGEGYAASLFSPLKERYVCGFVKLKDQPYEWMVFDIEQYTSTRLPLAGRDQLLMDRPGLLVYGCDTLSTKENATIVGWKKVEGGYGPYAYQLEWR